MHLAVEPFFGMVVFAVASLLWRGTRAPEKGEEHIPSTKPG